MQSGVTSKRFGFMRRLGEGGMGVVYEALDRDAGVRVALKTLKHATPEALARLKREFRAVHDLQHPSLVGLRELVCEDGRWFIVMDLVDGVDIVSYVRGFTEQRAELDSTVTIRGSAPTMRALPAVSPDAPIFDESRLRDVVRQLVEALHACHAAGFVHRDVKPSNVLVTRAGRVVVLDFGLVSDAQSDSSTQAIVGTPTYMAPEQAVSSSVGPEADLYSVGVLLYEALTGRLPIEGAALQVMFRKQSQEPAPPRDVAPGVPADLEALCLSLLRPRPSDRPQAASVLRSLGRARGAAEEEESRSRTMSPPFVGRDDELAVLRAAFSESRTRAKCALVEGESGVGKSRLVRRFAERVAIDEPRALVLSGRCYERESVPYKALDGVVDALARLLSKLPDAEARAVLPARPAALLQVFPVLRRIAGIAAFERDAVLPQDPFELRSRAFAALREMLVRIAEQRPLILVIDDAQWADEDSHILLSEILREPDAPRLLLVATARGSEDGAKANAATRSGAIARLERSLGAQVRTVHLAPLSTESSIELATLLLRSYGSVASDAATIAADARGHPLFIDILARRGGHSEGAGPAASSLEAALRESLAELDEEARAIVEIVSLADAPLRIKAVAAAVSKEAGQTSEGFVQALQKLRLARLVVGTGARGDDFLEPYHDRVRFAVIGDTPAEQWPERYKRIALALEAEGGADPGALAVYWGLGGDPARSSRYSALAGDRAAEGLAFDRAAAFYEDALRWAGLGPEDRRTLKAKLGNALANGGRGKAAADALREAAVGASAAESLDLRRRAADQLIRSGYLHEGVPAFKEVLGSVGVRMPSSTFWALLYLLVLRTWVRLRGLGYRKRDASQVSTEARARLDTRYAGALGLAMSDQLRGAALQSANLLAALRLGEPYRVARALALEVAYCGSGGTRSWRRTQKLIERSDREADACGHPLARALADVAAGTAYMLTSRYVDGLARVELGLKGFRDYARGDVAWELASGETFSVILLGYLGRLRDIRERVSRCLPEMERRGDLFGTVNMRIGYPNLLWLVGDDPDEARRQLDAAMAAWSRSGFHLTHYWALLGRINVALYSGDPEEAERRLREQWGPMQRSLLPVILQAMSINAWDMRSRVTLALAERRGGRNAALLRGVTRDARKLAAEGLPHATGLAALRRAAVAHCRDEREKAISLLRVALDQFAAHDMELNATVVRSVLGTLVGGDEGRALCEEAGAWFALQGVKRPEGFVKMVAPGFSDVGEVAPSGPRSRREAPSPPNARTVIAGRGVTSEVKGVWFAAARRYVLEEHGPAVFERFLRAAKETYRDGLRDPVNSRWYPEEMMRDSLAALHSEVAAGDDDLFTAAIERCAVIGVSRFVQFLMSVAAPGHVLRILPVTLGYIRRGPVRVHVEVRDRAATLRFTGQPYSDDPRYRLATPAIMRALLGVCVGEGVRATLTHWDESTQVCEVNW